MNGLYYNLAKKSTLVIILGIFLFSSTVEAKIPNDPSYLKQQKMWQQIGAERAWDFTTGSKQVTVAIIDTGADIWHEDLKPNIWVNPYEIAGNGYDDDSNGLVDDINGWNFIENNNDVRTSVLDNQDDPDAIIHGTIIAGLIGASGDNNKNGTGLNWKIKLMPLRAVASNGNGSYDQVSLAVRYAIDNGADVISMSVVGVSDSESLKELLHEAYNKGIVVVAAAGNDQLSGNGNLNTARHYPVCMDSDSADNWILGVSSVDENDNLSKFANYGNCVDLVAPGENIFSTERYAPAFGFLNEFGGEHDGTSFAVPLVAGSAALIKSIRPEWSAKEIISNLLKNSDNIQNINQNHLNDLGFGRLNVGKSVEDAASDASVSYSLSKDKYYYKNSIIYTKKDSVNYFVASAGDASMVNLASARSFNNKLDELFALVKRGRYYYVQFFTERGIKWKELAVPISDYSTKRIPTGIGVEYVSGVRKIKIQFSEKVVKKGKKTSTRLTAKLYDWLDLN